MNKVSKQKTKFELNRCLFIYLYDFRNELYFINVNLCVLILRVYIVCVPILNSFEDKT